MCMSGMKSIMGRAALMAIFFLLLASAGAAVAAPERLTTFLGTSESQPLSDSAWKDIRDKGSLIGFGKGVTGVAIQMNEGTGAQVSKIDGMILSGPGMQVQPLPSHIDTTLQRLQRLFRKWKR